MEWPWQYDFPPLYTLQPNEDTRAKQVEAWSDLILGYCKANKLYQLSSNDLQKLELFNNKKIDRRCSLELADAVLNALANRGNAEWIGPNNKSLSPNKKQPAGQPSLAHANCLILWNTVAEWASIVYEYVNRNSLKGSVCTFYELTEAKEVKNEKFYKIDTAVFKRCLAVLQGQGKAEVFQLDGDSEDGVKFF
jgi:ESCRT-II complex subunit VPS25